MTRFDKGEALREREWIKAEAKDRVKEICDRLLTDPEAYATKTYYFARNPGRADSRIGSFYVYLTGPAKGGFRDKASGESGDVVSLVQLALACDYGAAMDWLRDFTGYRNLTEERRAELERNRKAQEAYENLSFAEREAKRLERARCQWLAARPDWYACPFRGFVTPAERYVRECRGIDLDRLPMVTGNIRFAAGDTYPTHADRSKPQFIHPPALLSAIRDAEGKFIGLHKTYLQADGRDKLKVMITTKRGKREPGPARKMMPAGITGGMVWMNHGGTARPFRQALAAADRSEIVAFCEGIEDGWSGALLVPEARVAAMLSLSSLGSAPDLPFAAEYIVFRDNDWDKPEAVRAFEWAVERIRAFGKPVTILSSPIGKDFNDALAGNGA